MYAISVSIMTEMGTIMMMATTMDIMILQAIFTTISFLPTITDIPITTEDIYEAILDLSIHIIDDMNIIVLTIGTEFIITENLTV
jgi:hypothetical protein